MEGTRLGSGTDLQYGENNKDKYGDEGFEGFHLAFQSRSVALRLWDELQTLYAKMNRGASLPRFIGSLFHNWGIAPLQSVTLQSTTVTDV